MGKGIGTLKCSVVDVDDLAVAETFWSEVTGLPVIPTVFPGRYSYLGQEDPWDHQMILHLVKTPKPSEVVNRGHVDIWVDSIDEAIGQVEAIGGTLKRAPTIYPRPRSFEGEQPLLDWAVMRDPFANEFCLVRVLTMMERRAVAEAGAHADLVDSDLRAVAQRARSGS